MKQKIFALLALVMTVMTASAYELKVGTSEHGTITFKVGDNTDATSANEGDEVTVTITPADGWVVNQPSGQWYAAATRATEDISLLKDVTLTAVSGQQNQWTFTMQRANVEISATYKKLLTHTDIRINDIAVVTYNGQAQTPAVIVTDGSTPLAENTDYTVAYSDNTDAGTATVTITAVGTSDDYAGQTTTNFIIQPAAGWVTFNPWKFQKTFGDADFTIKPAVTGDGLVTYSSDDRAGTIATVDGSTGKVHIVGLGVVRITASLPKTRNYNAASDWYELTVNAKPLDAGMISAIAEQTYTGGPLTPAVEVKHGQTTLVEGTDYTVEYADNTEAGTATVTVTGQGNYTGEASATFTIVNHAAPDTEDAASVTIGATGKTTYTASRPLDFTNASAQAYIAVGYDAADKQLTLARIYQVPADMPILIKGAEGVFEIPFAERVNYTYQNMFVGNASGKTVEIGETDGDRTNYVMKGGEFVTVNANAYIPAGKAYLQLPTTFPSAKAGSDLKVTLTASGKSTVCAPVDLDFSGFSDMYAYAATGYDTQARRVMLSRVLKASAGTPLLLKGQSNATYTIPSKAAQTTFVNMLVGNTTGAAITVGETEGQMVNYYLSSGQFKAVVDNLTVPDGKAYLQIPAPAAADRTRGAAFDDYQIEENNDILTIRVGGDADETTGIEGLLKAAAEGQEVYYDLNGRRTDTPRKGIYVKGGRKVIVK